jgi:hypothetical protein
MNLYKIAKKRGENSTTKIRYVYASSQKEAEEIYRNSCFEYDCELVTEKQTKAGMVLAHRDSPIRIRDQIIIW